MNSLESHSRWITFSREPWCFAGLLMLLIVSAPRIHGAATNIAPQATVSASSYDVSRPDLYVPQFANDGMANVDDWYHWCNSFSTDSASKTNPVWLKLEWSATHRIRKLVVYTHRDFEAQNFIVEYRNGTQWQLFPTAVVTNNMETKVEFLAPAAVIADAIRLTATRGPEVQPELVRITELEAYEDDPVFDVPPASIVIRKLQTDPPVCRAKRPVVLTAQLANTNTTSLFVVSQMAVPSGVRMRQSAGSAPVYIPDHSTKAMTWVVEFDSAGTYELQLSADAGAGGVATRTLTVRALPAVAVTNQSQVPNPQPVQTTTLVGALNWPFWSTGVTDFWKPVVKHTERTPALGLYGQDVAQVNDWELKWASEHGINFFVYSWGRNGRGLPTNQWTFPFGNNHIVQRLTNSLFTSQVKCAVQFNNGAGLDGVGSVNDLVTNLAPYWIETFFKRADYLKVDNKPVLFIYDVTQLIADLGSAANVSNALASVRAKCVQAGFAGLYLVGESRFYNVPAPGGPEFQHVQQLKAAGMDYTFAYNWFIGASPDSQTAIDTQMTYYQKAREFNLIPPIMTASMGWSGWRDENSVWKLTPDGYQTLLQQIKAVNSTLPTNSLGSRMVLLDNWNEFGEGHYLAPHSEYGFGYLDAVRNVFATNASPTHLDLIPEDVGLGPYDTAFKNFQNRDAAVQPTASQMLCRVQPPEEGLVAWWTFDEEKDFPVAFDNAGNRLGGILRTATRTNSITGKALDCRGGGCVTVASDDRLSAITGLTVSCRVWTGVGGQDGTYILNRLYLGNDSGYQIGISAGKPFFRVPKTSLSHLLMADAALPLGRWVHLAGTCDGKIMRIFVDGQESGNLERFGKVNANDSTLWIGNYAEGAGAAFNGLIDDVKIYNRALSAAEIATQAVNATNYAPTAAAQSLSVIKNTAKQITLAGSHPESASIVSQPLHGTLTGTGATRTYTPAQDFTGADSFTFKVNNGSMDSLPATAAITVTEGGPNGLVGWWKLDETNGTMIVDSSGRGNHGAMQGGGWVAGRTGGALELNGTNGYVSILDNGDQDGMTAMTIAGWVKFTQMPPQNAVPIGKETGDLSYRIVVGANGAAQFVVATANNGWYSPGGWVDVPAGTFTAGNWRHVAGTYDGLRLRFYVNGALVGTGSSNLSGEIFNGNSPVTFGSQTAGNINFMPGAVDDVRIYSRVLSATEIQSLASGADIQTSFNQWAGAGIVPTSDLIRKYAIGGATNSMATGQMPIASLAGDNLILSAVVRVNDPLLTVLGQQAASLAGPWTYLSANPEGTKSASQANVPTGCERRDYSVPINRNQNGFLRLKIVYSAP